MGFTQVGESSLAPQRSGEWIAFFKCNKCQGGLVVEYKLQVNHGHMQPSQCESDPEGLGFQALKKYPGQMPTSTPAHVPPPLNRYYEQAANSLHSDHDDASGAMSRKVVDVSTQQMLGVESKEYRTIAQRIDALAAKNLLTPDLKDWAHEVRLGGNDAAHDEDPFSHEEAEELLSFVELYLTYVYALPGRLKSRRERAEEEKKKRAAAQQPAKP